VIDLSEISPECGLEWCHLLPLVTCRILVAGGDGTVGWVLQAIDNLRLKPSPEVCILPLGTGNDLARVLNWGDGYTGDIDVQDILHGMRHADAVKLDRWRVEVTRAKHFGIRMPRKTLMMNNYASIGVDALVTLNFHRHRESRPILFGSRLINKNVYLSKVVLFTPKWDRLVPLMVFLVELAGQLLFYSSSDSIFSRIYKNEENIKIIIFQRDIMNL
ncbi:hypothetical protein CAPTEDRAFT_217352, partial [Capitella teleta]